MLDLYRCRAVHEARTFVNAEVPEDRLDDLRRLLDPEVHGTEMGGEIDVFDNSKQVNMELNIEHGIRTLDNIVMIVEIYNYYVSSFKA